jgi:membrane-associated protease RseP (regulator of RpoE activity)
MDDEWNQIKAEKPDTNLDIEFIKREVGQRFPFYDLKYSQNTAAFFCRIDNETLEEKFNSLRTSISKKGYIPMLKYEKGEHQIYIIQRSKKKEKSIWINISLLIATIITTSLTGSILYMGYFDIWNLSNLIDIFNIENLSNGIFLFAFPLMSILLIHEMGHYFISKRHGIAASLPFFMPIPPIVPAFNIGTFGALISSRDPISDKKALFDIGIAGPLAGFIVALPITIIGITTSEIVPISQISEGEPILGFSLLLTLISEAILNVPEDYAINLSLIAFAGWVGLLITAINLFPAGQLDGGHIFRAVLGKKQKYAGWIAVIVMVFTGWLFFALIIIFVLGMMHPPPLNDVTKLDNKRRILFFVAVIILIICYVPYPISIT